MKKKNNFFKLCCENLIVNRYFFLSIILFFAITALIPASFLFAASLNTPGGGYRVSARTLSDPIFYYNGSVLNPIGCCVNNVSYQDYFVPTNSKAEWNSFYNSATSGAVRNYLTPVGCAGDGVCNLATENCLNAPADCGTCGAQCVNNGVCSTIERMQYANDYLLIGWRPSDLDPNINPVCSDCCFENAGVGTCGQCGGSEVLGDGCCTNLEWEELVMSERIPDQDRIDGLFHDCYDSEYTPVAPGYGGGTPIEGGGGGGGYRCTEWVIDGTPVTYCFPYT